MIPDLLRDLRADLRYYWTGLWRTTLMLGCLCLALGLYACRLRRQAEWIAVYGTDRGCGF